METFHTADGAQATSHKAVWREAYVTEAELGRLAALLAFGARPGDCIALQGDLGAGKTTFARAFLRAVLCEPEAEIPSPTFAIEQHYDADRMRLIHMDLYRLADEDESAETALAGDTADAVLLVEWPSKAGTYLPPDRIDLTINESDPKPGSEETRTVTLTAVGACGERLDRLQHAAHFLREADWWESGLSYLQGDASPRAYARLRAPDGRKAVFMDWPPVEDGLHDGTVSYARKAHLGITTPSFTAIALWLRNHGFAAPKIHAEDREHGFILLEDLGDETLSTTRATRQLHASATHMVMADDDSERYAAATDVAAEIARHPAPHDLKSFDGTTHTVPDFSVEAMQAEIALLPTWYDPLAGLEPSPEAAQALAHIFSELLQPLLDEPKAMALRDFHSPNLIWRPEDKGLARIGLIDFQDAVRTHPAYDLASLLQDARRDIPADVEHMLLDRYCTQRHAADANFDNAAFRNAFATLCAQRNTKLLGIFARLAERDGKTGYLQHLPRVWAYLERTLTAPHLKPLKNWFDGRYPAARRKIQPTDQRDEA